MQHLYLVQHNLASAVSIVFAASVGSVAFEAYEASVAFAASVVFAASVAFETYVAFEASIIFADTIALWSFGTLLGQYIPASGRYKIW